MFFLTFFTAVGATLSVAELFPMASRRVAFTTIRGVNVVDQRTFAVAGETTLEANLPVVYFGNEQLIIGNPSALKTPSPSGDLVYMNRKNWKNNFAQAVMNNQNVRKLFPAPTFGILYSKKHVDSFSLSDLQDIGRIIAELNRTLDSTFRVQPVPFLVDLRPGQLGIN